MKLPVTIVLAIVITFSLIFPYNTQAVTHDDLKQQISEKTKAQFETFKQKFKEHRININKEIKINIEEVRPTPSSTISPDREPTSVSLTPTLTPTPTKNNTPTPTVISPKNDKPTPTATKPSDTQTNQVQIYIMKEINKYRASKGLSEVVTDPYTCKFAKVRAKEISTDFSHDGFSNRIRNKTLPYPSYSRITENLAMTSNYKNVVSMWINSPGHAENMRQDTPYVCVEAYGNYYAYEGWRP